MRLVDHHPCRCVAHVVDQHEDSGHGIQAVVLFEDVQGARRMAKAVERRVNFHIRFWIEAESEAAFDLALAMSHAAGSPSRQSHRAHNCYLIIR